MSLISKPNPDATVFGFFNPTQFVIEIKKNKKIQDELRPILDENLENKFLFPDKTKNDLQNLTANQKRNIIFEQLRSLFSNSQELNNAVQKLVDFNDIDNFYKFGSIFLNKNKGLKDLTSNEFIQLWKDSKNKLLKLNNPFFEYYSNTIGPENIPPDYYNTPIGPENNTNIYNTPIGPKIFSLVVVFFNK